MAILLYGSQTGNAEDIAERISRRLRIVNFEVRCLNLADYDVRGLVVEKLAVFVCSTTGQGEVPDDMKSFWKRLLIKSLPSDALEGLEFCVVGLGDSSYALYNVVAKRLRKRLLQLGAHEVMPIALFDDQHEDGYDATFDDWLGSFLNVVLPESERHRRIDDDVLLPPKYRISHVEDKNTVEDESSRMDPRYQAEVLSNQRVTSVEHFQAVHLIKFRIDDNVRYEPGDVAVLMPENDPQNVEDFLKLLGQPCDKEFILQPMEESYILPRNLPTPCTLRRCTQFYWDIQSIPKRSFFDIIWRFSKSDIEKEKLKEFTTPEGREELYSYCNRPRRNILEVLQDFPNTTPYIPLEYYFELIPGIRPRSFSIASSLHYFPGEMHLLVAVVNYKTRLMKPRLGLCSNWLSRLCVHNRVSYQLKSGAIRLPQSNVPIVMIGPGTGCAPFRGFIQHRVIECIKSNYLFFGCRYKAKDFLCKAEWASFIDAGMLSLFVAFSRDQENKIYVQDRIREQKDLLWKLINDGKAVIYIAGNSKDMPTGVKDALKNVISEAGAISASNSEQYLKNLELNKRLLIETWS